MFESSVEIDRAPADVFAYVAEVDRHGEWQPEILAARKEPSGPTRVGTLNVETRRVPGGPREIASEIVEYDPPRRISARGVDGPLRAAITIGVEPLDEGRSRVSFAFELRAHGIGKLFAPFARRRAYEAIPANLQRLKARLETR